MSERTDIAIVGGGPAGMSAAINAAARGKSARLLSSEGNNLARAENVDNYLGFYGLSGAELMRKFEEHTAASGIAPEKGRAANIMPFGDYFMINFAGNLIEANTVILATGVARSREIEGEAALLGRGVSYCATCDGMLYRGKRAVVWGIAPDAVGETNFLNGIGVQVTLVAKGERPAELDSSIPFVSGAVGRVIGDDRVTAVMSGGSTIETDAIFILRSSIAPSTLVSGLETENGYIKVNSRMETNIPGLFAAGDCTGAPLQISKAVGEGLIAAQQAAKYIDSIKTKSILVSH